MSTAPQFWSRRTSGQSHLDHPRHHGTQGWTSPSLSHLPAASIPHSTQQRYAPRMLGSCPLGPLARITEHGPVCIRPVSGLPALPPHARPLSTASLTFDVDHDGTSRSHVFRHCACGISRGVLQPRSVQLARLRLAIGARRLRISLPQARCCCAQSARVRQRDAAASTDRAELRVRRRSNSTPRNDALCRPAVSHAYHVWRIWVRIRWKLVFRCVSCGASPCFRSLGRSLALAAALLGPCHAAVHGRSRPTRPIPRGPLSR